MDDPEKINILIVDDLPEKLLVYRSVLEELGENLITVRSGSEALKQVLKHDFAVILLDVNMPGMDGFETAQLIRQRKRSAHTPIIFLTAFADEVRTAQGYATGGVDYLPTPVVPEILRAKIRVFTDLFRLRKQVTQQAEEHAKRAAAEESARRSSFLADASRALASSLDLRATLERLARLPVPHIADACFVCLGNERQPIASTQFSWLDSRYDSISQAPADEFQPVPWLKDIVERVSVSGVRQVITELDEPKPLAEGGDEAAALQVAGLLVLPLIARGKTLGVLTLAYGPSGRVYKPHDVTLAEDLAGRAGIALENAMLVRDIQENDRRKNEFLAMLAHELRNPLAPIQNAVEILRLQGFDQPELVWTREVIHRQLTHMVRLVDDLLDMSRITRGKIQLQPRVVDLDTIIATAVETSRPLIEAHAHELLITLPNQPVLVKGDPARLAQVFANLLNNSAKYTQDGGMIELFLELEGANAVVRVRDNGAGIPEEMLSKVFDLFTQVNDSLDRSQGGLGIGLTLVHRLVEMHDGTVQAFSDGGGRGCEFVVRLPLHAEEGAVQTVDAPESPEQQAGAACRVLVVDDNVDAADTLAMLLRAGEHEVRLVHDGPSALEAAKAFRPHVVLLDIGLPGLNGYEVARRLREDPHTKDVLLVAVSGYGQDDDRRRSQQAGFDHHLVKPVNLDALQRIMPSMAVVS